MNNVAKPAALQKLWEAWMSNQAQMALRKKEFMFFCHSESFHIILKPRDLIENHSGSVFGCATYDITRTKRRNGRRAQGENRLHRG